MILTAFLLCFQFANADWRMKPSSTDVCSGYGSQIVVLSQTSALYLCQDQKTLSRYSVALGRGGLGKTTEGDLKTPVGTYPLGKPRPSKEYGTFIPMGYPTAEQKLQGYTGGAIGIHGPPRYLEGQWTGYLSQLANWTQGCIALATDKYVEEISNFVLANPKTAVVTIVE